MYSNPILQMIIQTSEFTDFQYTINCRKLPKQSLVRNCKILLLIHHVALFSINDGIRQACISSPDLFKYTTRRCKEN